MQPLKRIPRLAPFLVWLLVATGTWLPAAAQSPAAPDKRLDAYRQNLNALRQTWKGSRELPAISFFLFGMGDRRKMIYKDGQLKDAVTEEVLRKWPVKRELILPPDYTVELETTDGRRVRIREDEAGVYLHEKDRDEPLTESKLQLPTFAGHPYGPVLRVLHHEILINIHRGLPVPNFFVYAKPWFRDAALMGMVLKKTGNLHLVKEWILNIRDPFDRNNHGISEADNPGQVLYLLSLVADAKHPSVAMVLDSARQFRKGSYIEGKTDYALHPVYQTKWLKYGLKALGLEDPYSVPNVADNYSSLFWWAFKDHHVPGPRFDANAARLYPYLVWAEDHFYGEKHGVLGNRDYPLSWEQQASDARYPGLAVLDPQYVSLKLSAPHTWHAAEMFLLLTEARSGK
jgi:hypothetical protein